MGGGWSELVVQAKRIKDGGMGECIHYIGPFKLMASRALDFYGENIRNNHNDFA